MRRLENLELMLKYGTNAWRVHNQHLEAFNARYFSRSFSISLQFLAANNGPIGFWYRRTVRERTGQEILPKFVMCPLFPSHFYACTSLYKTQVLSWWTDLKLNRPTGNRIQQIVRDHSHEIEALNRERKSNQVRKNSPTNLLPNCARVGS